MPDTGAVEPPGDELTRFTVTYDARTVLLTVYPPPGGARPVSAGEVATALQDVPLDGYSSERVFSAVRSASGVPVAIGEVEVPGKPAGTWAVKVAASKAAAFLVPLAPPPGADAAPLPAALTAREAFEALAAARVSFGVLADAIEVLGEGTVLESVIEVARGRHPAPGKDAAIELTFDANPQLVPVTLPDGSVDYHAAQVQRFVEAGGVLALRRPPTPGLPGMNVFGQEIPAKAGSDRQLASVRGKGTEIEGDSLVAKAAGRPLLVNGKVEVLPVFEVRGDIDFSVGNIDFIGDVMVTGDVKPGFRITAGGTVTVRGIVDRASIVAGKDVIVRGVTGGPGCRIEAGNDIAAHYIHNTAVVAGRAIKINRELVNCHSRAKRIEGAAGSAIIGGLAEADEEIVAGTIGSSRGVPGEIVVHGSRDNPGPVRAFRAVHPRVVLKVHHAVGRIDDDYPGCSFWEVEGEIARLGPAAAPPKPQKPAESGDGHSAAA